MKTTHPRQEILNHLSIVIENFEGRNFSTRDAYTFLIEMFLEYEVRFYKLHFQTVAAMLYHLKKCDHIVRRIPRQPRLNYYPNLMTSIPPMWRSM